MNQPGQGSLARWSRRKARARAGRPEAEPGGPPPPTSDTSPAATAPEDEAADAELLRKLELPDPEGMKPGDDFSAFLRSEVPERLRRRALRTLWRSDPVLANLDELLEYGEDYTDAATVVGNLKTAYRVGKGWLTDEEQEANRARIFGTDGAEEEAAKAPAQAETASEKAPEAEETAAGQVPEEDLADSPPAAGEEEAVPAAPAPPAEPARRSMAFRFDGD